MKRLLDILFALMHPSYWIAADGCDEWTDKTLNTLMDTGARVHRVDNFTVMLGDKEVWIRNFPYAYGSISLPDGHFVDLFPYRRTRARLKKYITRKIGENHE